MNGCLLRDHSFPGTLIRGLEVMGMPQQLRFNKTS